MDNMYIIRAKVGKRKTWCPTFVKEGDVVYLDAEGFIGTRWTYFDNCATMFKSSDKAVASLKEHEDELFDLANVAHSFVADRNTVEIIELAPKVVMRSGDIWEWE